MRSWVGKRLGRVGLGRVGRGWIGRGADQTHSTVEHAHACGHTRTRTRKCAHAIDCRLPRLAIHYPPHHHHANAILPLYYPHVYYPHHIPQGKAAANDVNLDGPSVSLDDSPPIASPTEGDAKKSGKVSARSLKEGLEGEEGVIRTPEFTAHK